jgi:hypothetical protein
MQDSSMCTVQDFPKHVHTMPSHPIRTACTRRVAVLKKNKATEIRSVNGGGRRHAHQGRGEDEVVATKGRALKRNAHGLGGLRRPDGRACPG